METSKYIKSLRWLRKTRSSNESKGMRFTLIVFGILFAALIAMSAI